MSFLSMAGCVIDQVMLDKLARMQAPVVKTFAAHVGRKISWDHVHWLYIQAQADYHRGLVGIPENVQEMLWVTDLLHGSEHLLWLGLICYNRASLEHVMLRFNSTQAQGISELHRMWERFCGPVETPTTELKAEFDSRLEGANLPIHDAADYARRVEQIQPGTCDDRDGLQSVFANVSAVPTVVYSWDPPGAFTPPQ